MMFFFKKKHKRKQDDKNEKSRAKKAIFNFCEQRNPVGLVNYLKKTKANVNICNNEGRYPIHVAAKTAIVELVDILLEAGSWKNVAEENTRRWNVLHYAIASRSLEMVYRVACFPGLISNYRGLITHQDAMMADQNTPLHYYCSFFCENYKNCVSLIINSGADVNSQNQQGDVPLNAASRLGSLEIVQLLLDSNAKPNIPNKQGETALHFAARSNSLDVIRVLLAYGAKKMVRGQYGYPVDVATSSSAKKALSINFAPSDSLASDPSQVSSYGRVHIIREEEICMGPKVSFGGFSDLYKCIWRGIEVAIKKIRLSSNENLVQFFAEVEIMSKLRHNNVLLIFGAYANPPNGYLISEFMKGGSLYDYLRKKKHPFEVKLNMAIEAAKGLVYLHNQNPPIIHRDLKTRNILVDENNHVKLADFGLSVVDKGEDHTSAFGTLASMPPETLEYQIYDEKSDVYAFGLILWEIATDRGLFEGLDNIQIIKAIEEKRTSVLKGINSEFESLVYSCLSIDPSNRPVC